MQEWYVSGRYRRNLEVAMRDPFLVDVFESIQKISNQAACCRLTINSLFSQTLKHVSASHLRTNNNNNNNSSQKSVKSFEHLKKN